MRNRGKKDSEDIWADPEAILRPTEGERLTSIIEDFENERYPQMMALGWVNQVLERLPENQAVLRELLNQLRVELSSLVIAMNIGMDRAHQMLSECTGEPVPTSSSLSPTEALGEEQTRQLAAVCDDDIRSAEDAERNTVRQEWYSEKQAATWIVETLNMLPLDRTLSSLRKILVATRRALLRRMAEIEKSVEFDLVMYFES